MENSRHIAAQREIQQKKYNSARSNLLLAIILTVVNIVLLYVGSGYMLLFSVSVPYYVAIAGYLYDANEVCLVVAAVILAVYFLCWLFSKKKSGWLLVATILFVFDTLALACVYLLAEEMYGILDAVIHVALIYYMIVGLVAAGKLKKMPVVTVEELAEELPAQSTPLRWAQEDVKCRILMEEVYAGHKVCYRRVKRVNEFIIDGKVYDEYEAMVEFPHTLTARIDGHTYEMTYDNNSRMVFKVDGQEIAKKIRLI